MNLKHSKTQQGNTYWLCNKWWLQCISRLLGRCNVIHVRMCACVCVNGWSFRLEKHYISTTPFFFFSVWFVSASSFLHPSSILVSPCNVFPTNLFTFKFICCIPTHTGRDLNPGRLQRGQRLCIWDAHATSWAKWRTQRGTFDWSGNSVTCISQEDKQQDWLFLNKWSYRGWIG